MKKLSCAGLLMVFLAESVATAHPGHGVDGGDHSLTHYITEPSHLVLGFGWFALLSVVCLSWKLLARFRKSWWQYQATK